MPSARHIAPLAVAAAVLCTAATPARAQDAGSTEPAAAVRQAVARIEGLPDWGRAAAALAAPFGAARPTVNAADAGHVAGAAPVTGSLSGQAARKAIAAAVLAVNATPGAAVGYGHSFLAFNPGKRVEAAERTLAAWGLPARDLASAAAYAFVTDWGLATGRPLAGDAARAAARALAARFAQAAPDALGALDERGRAAAYEATLGHAQALVEVARGANAGLAAGVRAAADASFRRQFALAPSTVALDATSGAPGAAATIATTSAEVDSAPRAAARRGSTPRVPAPAASADAAPAPSDVPDAPDAGPASAMAQAAEDRPVAPDSAAAHDGRLFGVRWTPPAGVRAADGWAICPLKCAVYEGRTVDDRWPLVAVFEPYVGSAEDALRHWARARRATSTRPSRGLSAFTTLPSAAGRLVRATYAEDDDTPANSAVALFALERGGVSVPLVLWAHRRSDWPERLPAVQTILGSLQFDGAAIRAGVADRARVVAEAQRGVNAALARGERPVVYWGMDQQNAPAGPGSFVQLAVGRTVGVAFLPGGVFAPELPPSLARPDVALIAGRDAPQRWRRDGAGYVVTRADGSTARYAALPGGRLRWAKDRRYDAAGLLDTVEFEPVARPAAADLAGRYEFASSFAAAAVPGEILAVGGRERTLVLAPDGRYTLAGTSSSNATGSPVVREGREGEAGTWRYDPASWTLTLAPAAGRPTACPAFRPPFTRNSSKGDEWVVCGLTWRRAR